MPRCVAFITVILISIVRMVGQSTTAVVADASTRVPLPFASVFDRYGKAIGVSDRNGRLPAIPSKSYPLTIRYIGFDDQAVPTLSSDTIFLNENTTVLPEVVVDSRKHKLLHVLAYVREYSSMSTYSDTVFLFREKMVDYMLPSDSRVKYKGWTAPRTITVKSYYRFTDNSGLDSVSDISNHHFSWSDWIGLAPNLPLPAKLLKTDIATDTLWGKYSPCEIWARHNDKVSVDVDILADTASRRWTPALLGFFRNGIEYDYFKISYRYDNIEGEILTPADIIGCTYRVESNGRGRDMFRFNRPGEPFFVSTFADVYILDKEYITEKDARKWADRKFDIDNLGIFEATDAPPLSPEILALVNRVNNIDRDMIRLNIEPDKRLISKFDSRDNFKIGNRALMVLKQLTGISSIKFHNKRKKEWNEFRRKVNTEFDKNIPATIDSQTDNPDSIKANH